MNNSWMQQCSGLIRKVFHLTFQSCIAIAPFMHYCISNYVQAIPTRKINFRKVHFFLYFYKFKKFNDQFPSLPKNLIFEDLIVTKLFYQISIPLKGNLTQQFNASHINMADIFFLISFWQLSLLKLK